MQFQVSSEKELTGKEIPESSRLEFLEKISTNHFPLLDAEDNTFGLLDRGGIADLPFLITLIAIHQKFQKPSFWEVMYSFVLLAYATLATSTLLQQILACLNFGFRRFILFVKKKNSDFYELWRQQKQLETIEMSSKFTSISRSTEFKDILP